MEGLMTADELESVLDAASDKLLAEAWPDKANDDTIKRWTRLVFVSGAFFVIENASVLTGPHSPGNRPTHSKQEPESC